MIQLVKSSKTIHMNEMQHNLFNITNEESVIVGRVIQLTDGDSMSDVDIFDYDRKYIEEIKTLFDNEFIKSLTFK